MKDMALITDSSTVHRWLHGWTNMKNLFMDKSGQWNAYSQACAYNTGIGRRVQVERHHHVGTSADNKVDILMRVLRRRIAPVDAINAPVCLLAADPQPVRLITEVHGVSGHPGVRRTPYFSRRLDPRVHKSDVIRVDEYCNICQSIYPALLPQ
ncbi:hypothetical protein M514_08298 [Trichuris suis]|uniref:Uncharacterized protein n=1 Tax=Trichuris suis TaxID=68888 RepID=A0A085M0W4_9BILA|nr:hypothetical protein M513_08298 [Trichuris suis]KFD68940.1 hypothetical protein M514_08298 [Trichuris suis]